MSSKVDKVCVSIPFPFYDYQELREMPCFVLIYPFSAETAQALNIEKTVRAVVFDDDDYAKILTAEDPRDLQPEGYEYYEIEYIRDCALRSVVNGEWKNNYSCTSLDEYLSMEPYIQTPSGVERMGTDSKVRVVCLKRVRPNLRELNKRYGQRTKKN